MAARVYREKYPEVFRKEAAGERSLKKVTSFLAEHPEMTPAFEKWLEGRDGLLSGGVEAQQVARDQDD